MVSGSAAALAEIGGNAIVRTVSSEPSPMMRCMSVASLSAVAGEEGEDLGGGRSRRAVRRRETDVRRPIMLAVLDFPDDDLAPVAACAVDGAAQPARHGLTQHRRRGAAIGCGPEG